jgi:hypothetical protein
VATELEITGLGVRVQGPRGRTATTWERPAHFDIEIHVRNRSKRTLLVVSRVRRQTYDADTGTLHVWLAEVASTEVHRYVSSYCRAPIYARVLSVQSSTLTVNTPVVIDHIRGSGGLGLAHERVDMSGLKKVHCVIAYSNDTTSPEAASAVGPAPQRLTLGGKIVELTRDLRGKLRRTGD